jgi:SH3-like domain-containing protein
MKTGRFALAAVLAATLAVHAGTTVAADFRSIGAAPAIMYDAPSEKGRKVFVAPRNMPVEIVLSYQDWVKVRDAGGDLAWVEGRALTPKRHVVANVAGFKMRAAADEASPVVMTADKGVLFELAEPVASGWVKVKHRDGLVGYAKAAEVWGV